MQKINTYKEFITESEWYRGHSTKTNTNDFVWMTADKKQAENYAKMNSIIQGGESILSDYDINLSEYNVIDFSEYDMDDRLEGYELDDVLDELEIEYDYESLFDFTEDDIPLSRLVNNILPEIMSKCDVFLVKEDGIDTILIKRELL